MKRLLKLTGILILSLILLTGVISVTAYLFRDRIIREVVNRINETLDTPVKVDHISLDILQHFPELTLRFNKVEIDESRRITGLPVCEAGNIRISFGLFDLISRNYRFHSLYLQNTVLDLAVDTAGNTNYRIFSNKKGQKSGDSTAGPTVTIKNIILENVSFNYTRFTNGNSVILHFPELRSRLRYGDNIISAYIDGKVNSEKIYINGINYLAGETTLLKTDFLYDIGRDIIHFRNSSLSINNYTYSLNGMIGTTGDQEIDLSIGSAGNDLKAITALLPEEYRNYLKDYRSSGKVDFHGKITGGLNSDLNPLVEVAFSCNQVTLYQPSTKKTLRNITFSGRFTNGNKRNFETSNLEIKDLNCELEGKKIRGDLAIHDLNKLNLTLDLSADLNLGTVLTFFPVKNIKAGRGSLNLNIRMSGPVREVESHRSRGTEGSRIIASGDVTLENADLQTYYSESSLTGLNGIFHFNNADLAIENFTGYIGSSDFRLSGFFKNILPFILLPDQRILIEADFQSDFLNLNELLKVNFAYGDTTTFTRGYHLDISPKLDVRLNCRVRHVILKKFSARNVTGKVTVRDQRIIVDDANMNSMGGKLTLSGSVSARQPGNREILADGHLEGIHIDSVFYVFNNFNQDFLVSHHLKGQIYADVNTFLALDENLAFKPESLLSFINISIVNGELNNFEPMQKLSKYIDSEALKHLRFSELRNDIQVKNKVITIPQMEIISNVSTITVSGTHTFDQHIDYHFMVPLSQFRKEDPDSRFGDIEESGGGMNVFLKMSGATDDYKVSYDTKAMKNKVVEDIRKEGQELKEIFKKKDRKTDTKVGLEEGDYFDE